MKVVIFGAGYVGTVTGACLAKRGHEITFIEPSLSKVEILNAGKSPILEPKIDELIQEGICSGKIRAKAALEKDDLFHADIAMIAVATPSSSNGLLQLDCLRTVFITIKEAVLNRSEPLTVAIRSTIHPIALRKLEQEYELSSSSNISLVANPEFLRESTAVHDFFNAPFCVAGGDDAESIRKVLSLYQEICPKLFATNLELACLLKYTCNAFHALKIAFANEIGSLCESLKINPLELADLFCEDKILNCSSAYLKPGFSFGGSCLPKDLRVLLALGRDLEETLPLLSSILPSNQCRFQKFFDEILSNNHQRLAVIGMSFKKNNDDLRESPFVELIEQLVGKGVDLSIFDPDVRFERLGGSNLETFKRRFGHLIPLLKDDLHSALDGCDGVVLCKDFLNESIVDQLQEKEIPIYDIQYHLLRADGMQNPSSKRAVATVNF